MPSPHRLLVFKHIVLTTSLVICFLLYHHSWLYRKQLTPPGRSVLPTFTTPNTTLPKKIWYKLGPKGLSNDTRKWTESCLKKNPSYRYEFITDLSGDAYVEHTFASHPEIVDIYLNLPIPILKADLLRYLILFAEGGIWSDLDVSCDSLPIDEWIPPHYKDHAGLVVGWEFDAGHGDNLFRQFATWTIMAKPGIPHLWMVIEDILRAVRDTATKSGTSVAELKLGDVGDVVDFTGPRRFTRSIFESLERTVGTIDHAALSNLLEPKMVGDLLILPGYAFAALTNSYPDKESLGSQLVTHHYAGSWKNENGGETA